MPGTRALIACVALGVVVPAVARATTCVRPADQARLFVGANGRLPGDAHGIPWLGRWPEPERKLVVRHQGADLLRRDVPFTREGEGMFDMIVPDGGLRPGEIYEVAVYTESWSRRQTITVDPQPLSLTGAALELGPRRRMFVSSRGRRGVADTIVAQVLLPPAAQPYREYLGYETYVDGELYRSPGSNQCARRRWGRSNRLWAGAELLVAMCDGSLGGPFGGTKPGKHTVSMVVMSPDGHRVALPEQAFELDCATSPDSTPVAEPAAPATMEPASPVVMEPAASVTNPSEQPAGPPPVARGCSTGDGGAWSFVLLLLWLRRSRS